MSTPTLTGTELDRAISTAARAYISAKRSGDQQRIADTDAQLAALILMRDASA